MFAFWIAIHAKHPKKHKIEGFPLVLGSGLSLKEIGRANALQLIAL